MKKRTQLSLVMTSVALAVGAASAQAAELEITVTNATKGIYFTPLIVAAHGSDLHMFKVGESATAELEAMAEGGGYFWIIDRDWQRRRRSRRKSCGRYSQSGRCDHVYFG